MTVEKDTVYRGLLRPAKLFGLPLTSAVILLATVLLGFMWAESFWALATVIVFYPALFGHMFCLLFSIFWDHRRRIVFEACLEPNLVHLGILRCG